MIRKTTEKDIDTVMEVYAYAQDFMARTGNPNQWGKTNPPRWKVESDVREGNGYVLYDEDGIYGAFFFRVAPDPTYTVIEDGEWEDDGGEYGVIHRIAGNGRRRGVLAEVVEFGETQAKSLRIDTHHDNVVMQNALAKCGFTRRGIIYLENGDPRIAYQKKLTSE